MTVSNVALALSIPNVATIRHSPTKLRACCNLQSLHCRKYETQFNPTLKASLIPQISHYIKEGRNVICCEVRLCNCVTS